MAITSSSYDRFQPPGPEDEDDANDTLARMHADMRRIAELCEEGCSEEGFGYLSLIAGIAGQWVEDAPAGDGEIPF